MISQRSREVLTKETAQASVPGMNWMLNNNSSAHKRLPGEGDHIFIIFPLPKFYFH